MSKTKDELEQAIVMLEEKVVSNTSEMISVQADLLQYKKQLQDVNKPGITSAQMDAISEAIEEGVDNFDFSDEDNFDTEFGINYDGKVHLENLELNSSQELIEMIVEEVHKLFVEIEDEDND